MALANKLIHFKSFTSSTDSELLDDDEPFPQWVLDEAAKGIPFDLHTAASLGESNFLNRFFCVDRIKNTELCGKANLGGWSPLMYASYLGHDEVVRSLISEFSADVNCRGYGRTPLMLATCCGYQDVTLTLIEMGADLEIKVRANGGCERTALSFAVFYGQQRALKSLISYGARVRLQDIRLAIVEGEETVLKNLLECTQNHEFNFSDHLQLLLDLAVTHKRDKLVHLLQEHVLLLYAPVKSQNSRTRPTLTETKQNNKTVVTPTHNKIAFPSSLDEVFTHLNLTKYLPMFLNQDVDLQTFVNLSEEDLKELGVALIGPRRKLAKFITQLAKTYPDHGFYKSSKTLKQPTDVVHRTVTPVELLNNLNQLLESQRNLAHELAHTVIPPQAAYWLQRSTQLTDKLKTAFDSAFPLDESRTKSL